MYFEACNALQLAARARACSLQPPAACVQSATLVACFVLGGPAVPILPAATQAQTCASVRTRGSPAPPPALAALVLSFVQLHFHSLMAMEDPPEDPELRAERMRRLQELGVAGNALERLLADTQVDMHGILQYPRTGSTDEQRMQRLRSILTPDVMATCSEDVWRNLLRSLEHGFGVLCHICARKFILDAWMALSTDVG